ncbi:MAG: S46 family peptidase, partial [Salinibacter sp.]
MRLSMRRLLIVVLLGAGLLAGCGGSETVSVPVVERPDPAPAAEEDTLRAGPPAYVVPVPAPYDTVEARRFDRGRMWPFTSVPTEYFQDAYGFTPDEAWLTKARRAALRFGDGCSASFVSPNGLVMTNHHCARTYVTDVSRAGESLLQNGFYASTRDEERRARDLYVDQLVNVEEVTDRVFGDLRRRFRPQSREQRVQALEEKMTAKASERDSSLRVEVRALYQGTRYVAYTY